MTVGNETMWAQVVDALNGIYGVHTGHRGVHAKGTLCSGTFTATPSASKLTKAPHMQGESIRAHVRFSNANGNPGTHDGSSDSRGMAVKFYLPDGTTTDVSAVTIPVFVVRTPEDFLELTLARQPKPNGEIDMEKIGAFLNGHPEAIPAIEAAMTASPPASYLQCSYHAVHAFGFVDADGGSRWVRYRWEPEAGEAWLDHAEAKQREPDYLTKDLADRFGQSPAGFRLWAQIAEEGDPLNDPTAAWPEDRENVELGHLELTGLASDREQDGDVLVFDPTRVPDGIELSEDRILHARPHAYAESVFRRTGQRRQ